jgi:hypothetical protein
VYYGQQREFEYDFVVAAGANPKLIRFRVEGADQIRLTRTGELVLGLKHGDVHLHKPMFYQLEENGSRSEVKGAYVINGNEVRFKLERFDSSKPLVIDPVLSYSTLLDPPKTTLLSGSQSILKETRTSPARPTVSISPPRPELSSPPLLVAVPSLQNSMRPGVR